MKLKGKVLSQPLICRKLSTKEKSSHDRSWTVHILRRLSVIFFSIVLTRYLCAFDLFYQHKNSIDYKAFFQTQRWSPIGQTSRHDSQHDSPQEIVLIVEYSFNPGKPKFERSSSKSKYKGRGDCQLARRVDKARLQLSPSSGMSDWASPVR